MKASIDCPGARRCQANLRTIGKIHRRSLPLWKAAASVAQSLSRLRTGWQNDLAPSKTEGSHLQIGNDLSKLSKAISKIETTIFKQQMQFTKWNRILLSDENNLQNRNWFCQETNMAYRTESYIVMQQTTLAKHEVILSDNKSHLQDINDHCKCFMVVAELGRTKVGYFGLLPRWYAHFLDDSGGFPVF